MKIAIPLFAVMHRKIGGTESAVYNLIIGLAQQRVRLDLVHAGVERLSPEFNAWLSAIPANVSLRRGWALAGPKSLRFLEETLFGFDRNGADWVLYPNYFISLFRRRNQKVAVILHDVQYKTLPKYHSKKRKAWLDFYLPWMFRRADLVLVVSQSEKDIIRRHFGDAAADKCAVIYNAIDWTRLEARPSTPDSVNGVSLKQRYVFSVSFFFPHKNLKSLLAGFDLLNTRHPDLHLYLAGIAAPETLEFLEKHMSPQARARTHMLGFLSDADLGSVYRNAAIFAMPSLYEGFGMPAVEALGFGIPTLTTNLTALPEVTLGQARYIEDALSPQAWAEGLDGILASGWRPSPQTVAQIRSRFDIATVARALLDKLAAFA